MFCIVRYEFKQLVRNKVVILEPRKIDLLRSVYTDFFKQLCAVTNCSGGEDSNPYKYSASKWSFFTTNYDNALEDFWVNHRKYPLDVGFTNKNGKKVMDAERFVHYNNSNTYSAMQLVKLHGSVNWIRNRDEDIEEVGYHLNYDEVKARTGSTDIQEDMMIYPVSQKQLYFTPFLQFFRILDAELKRRNFWIVIGYSFRDVIVRTMFERGLGENNKRKILLVHPHASEQIKPLFQASVSDQVICLDSYFATRNYGYVNKDIADALSNMANPYRT